MTDRSVHPAAAVFPMLSHDDLRDLADDIAANGLHHPIVLDAEGVVIDGRNRLAACKLADIEPTFTTFEGHDPVAYILSENVQRRHMSAGQRAMAVAMVGGLSQTTVRQIASENGVSHSRIVYASVVLEYAPDLAALVLAGSEHLDAAYRVARERKAAKASDEAKRLDAERKLAKLHAEAPDLAALVGEWRISLDEAEAALAERARRENEAKRATTSLMVQTLDFLDPRAMTPHELAESIARRVDPKVPAQQPDLSRERLERCAATLALVVDMVSTGGNNGGA